MTPECCACVSAERLRRPSGVSEHGLLGTWGCDHSHEALWTRGAAKHLHPGVCLCGLDQEGHGDGLETTNWPPTGTDQTHYWSPREQFFTFTHMHMFSFFFFVPSTMCFSWIILIAQLNLYSHVLSSNNSTILKKRVFHLWTKYKDSTVICYSKSALNPQ